MLYKDDVPNVEVGAEVGDSFLRSGRVEPSSLPAGRAAATVVRGAPSAEGLGRGHELVRRWCSEHGHEVNGVRREVYGHWLEDQDPAVYEIEVFWLLSSGIAGRGTRGNARKSSGSRAGAVLPCVDPVR